MNLLENETSPYLLQHKNNPVHWRPWSPEALAEAERTGKPILLSVGYAACHWCHVMAHESFEQDDVAGLMNELFVNIKVDREERPDLDAIYQSALAGMGQQGGWPLTMFLNARGEPFWGGTYFPREPRYGRPAFADVLKGVAHTYGGEPEKIAQNVAAIREALDQLSRSSGPLAFGMDLLDQGARQLMGAIDPANGGLRGAPKFPQPFLFEFLWRAARRTGEQAMAQAVRLTLDRMSQGGIYDHLGGGFSRYSTDALWLAPHFEKMLYDNALMIDLLTLVWQETKTPLYAARVAETVEWALREMVAEGGAFASSLDADSEGEEGRFYVWSEGEIDALLGGDAKPFKQAYDVRSGGNWEGSTILNRNAAAPHPTPPHEGEGAASSPPPLDGEGWGGVTAARDEFEKFLADSRAVLWRERERRVRPGRDDKVLADWNGLMIAAMANAAFVFDIPRWLDAARRAFATVAERMSVADDRLAHSMRHGRVQRSATVDDYADMARAALTLFEVTAEPGYLARAEGWTAAADRHYRDAAAGGYFYTADDADDVILRTKSAIDNAVPSGNGTMVQVLAHLFHLTGRQAYRDRAEAIVAAFSGDLPHRFANMTALLIGYEMLTDAVQIVIVGEPGDADTRDLTRVVAETCLPGRVLSLLTPGRPLPAGHPAQGKDRIDGKATAYVCFGPSCSPPATSPDALREALVRG